MMRDIWFLESEKKLCFSPGLSMPKAASTLTVLQPMLQLIFDRHEKVLGFVSIFGWAFIVPFAKSLRVVTASVKTDCICNLCHGHICSFEKQCTFIKAILR